MTESEVVTKIVLFVLLGGLVLVMFFLFGMAEHEKQKKIDKFTEILRQAVISEKLQATDLRHLTDLYGLTEKEMLDALRRNLAAALGSSGKSQDEAIRFRKHLEWHAEQHPYAELPDDIRIQMEALKAEMPGASLRLRDLAVSLTDLYKRNRAELAKQTTLSKWSFWFGVLGVALAIFFGVVELK